MEWLRLSAFAALFFSFAAAAQLNPTVVVLRSATAVVPESCASGIAPQERPRVEVSQIPEPAHPVANVAPPSKSLRSLLHDAQSAAVRGDHTAFRAAFTQAKEMLATFPAGGERNAATDVIRVFDDLDRVWSWQLDTPTGSFFDASTPPFEVMRGYPGYEKAISDQLFIDSTGRRFYPTSETRDYLTRQAAQRLGKLGVSAPMRAERAPRVLPKSMTRTATTAAISPAPAKGRPAVGGRRSDTDRAVSTPTADRRPPTAPATRHATTRVAETKHAKPSSGGEKAAPHVPVVSGSMARPSGSAHTEPKPAPAAAKKAAPPVALPMTTSETATAPSTSAETAAHEAAPPAIDTAGTGTATTAAEGTATATQTAETTELTPPSTTSNPPASQQPQGKGIILPIILIVVGVGVLIVLFRASS